MEFGGATEKGAPFLARLKVGNTVNSNPTLIVSWETAEKPAFLAYKTLVIALFDGSVLAKLEYLKALLMNDGSWQILSS
jgi:hypothetical protein